MNSGAQTSQQLGRPVASPRTCLPPWIWFCAEEGWEMEATKFPQLRWCAPAGDLGPIREANGQFSGGCH